MRRAEEAYRVGGWGRKVGGLDGGGPLAMAAAPFPAPHPNPCRTPTPASRASLTTPFHSLALPSTPRNPRPQTHHPTALPGG
jgi:hypothetical protein